MEMFTHVTETAADLEPRRTEEELDPELQSVYETKTISNKYLSTDLYITMSTAVLYITIKVV